MTNIVEVKNDDITSISIDIKSHNSNCNQSKKNVSIGKQERVFENVYIYSVEMYQRRKIRNKLIHILDVTNVTIGYIAR